jgi:hypothetical protein
MQDKKESQQKIERARSKLTLRGLAYGAIFGALAWGMICELWLNQSPPRKDMGIVFELIIGGFTGACLGFIVGLGIALYQYPAWSLERVRNRSTLNYEAPPNNSFNRSAS